MKIAFVHDHIFTHYQGSYFSSGKLTDKTWQRYLSFADKLLVFSRVKFVSNQSAVLNMNETTSEQVSFSCIDKISLLDRIWNQRIKERMRKEFANVDVVVCRLPSFLGSLAFDVAEELKKKTIVEVVGCPYDAYKHHGSIIAKLLAPLAKKSLKKTMQRSLYSIYVTSEFLQKRYPSNGIIINASNVEILHSYQRVKIKGHVRVIKFIGSLNCVYKGFDDLLEAFKVLKASSADLTLHVLGGGQKVAFYKQKVQRLGLNNSVLFFDPIPGGEKVIEWLSEGDIYVQPSHTEGLPRAMIEAMSLGLPCVGTNVGGIPELLQDDCLCAPKKPEELASKILNLVENKTLRIEVGSENFQKAKEFDSQILESRRFQFFKQVIKNEN